MGRKHDDGKIFCCRVGNRRLGPFDRAAIRWLLRSGQIDARTLTREADAGVLRPLGGSAAAVEIPRVARYWNHQFSLVIYFAWLVFWPLLSAGIAGWGAARMIQSPLVLFSAWFAAQIGASWWIFRLWRIILSDRSLKRAALHAWPTAVPVVNWFWIWPGYFALARHWRVLGRRVRITEQFPEPLFAVVIVFFYLMIAGEVGWLLLRFFHAVMLEREVAVIAWVWYGLMLFSLLLADRFTVRLIRRRLHNLIQGALATGADISYSDLLTTERMLNVRLRHSVAVAGGILLAVGWLIAGWFWFKTIDVLQLERIRSEWAAGGRQYTLSGAVGNAGTDLINAVEDIADRRDFPALPAAAEYVALEGASDECMAEFSRWRERNAGLLAQIDSYPGGYFLPLESEWFFQTLSRIIRVQINDALLRGNRNEALQRWRQLSEIHESALSRYVALDPAFSIRRGAEVLNSWLLMLNSAEFLVDELAMRMDVCRQREDSIRGNAARTVYRYLVAGLNDAFAPGMLQQGPILLNYVRLDFYEFVEELALPAVPAGGRTGMLLYLPSGRNNAVRFFLRFNLALLNCRVRLTALALRMYALEHHGQLPDSLDELVPEYLSDLPVDPFAGAPFEYRRGMVEIPSVYLAGGGRFDRQTIRAEGAWLGSGNELVNSLCRFYGLTGDGTGQIAILSRAIPPVIRP